MNFWKELRASLPTIVFTIAGFAVSILDYSKESQIPQFEVGAVVVALLGGSLELWVRFTLMEKAKFPDLLSTKRLMVVDEHTLITDGVFGLVRHPLYLGRIVAQFGIPLFFSSLWGAVLMALSAGSLLFRIRAEEEMLIEEFSDAYREYRSRTKMLIPWIY